MIMTCVSLLAVLLCALPVRGVKTCIFCADLIVECRKNMRAFQPIIMNCETFLIKNQPIKEYFKRPNYMKLSSSELYNVGLPSKNIKTLCVSIVYKHKGGFGLWNVTSKEIEFYFNNDTFKFQSCMYELLAEYKDACHYFTDIFKQNYLEVEDCQMCKSKNCNGVSNRYGTHYALLFLLINLLLLLIIVNKV